MPSSSDPSPPSVDRAILSARADQFFAALARGAGDDWESFLSGLSGAVRLAVLNELAIIDLAHRWAKGEHPRVEDYITRFPELGPTERVSAALILEELRCRAQAGETIDPESFRARFPVQYPGVRDRLTGVGAEAKTVLRPRDRFPVDRPSPPTEVVPSPPEAVPGPEMVVSLPEQYEVVRELGRGMFGQVWLARKKPSGIEKAVKILLQPADEEVARRELRALELIKNLRHPYLLATEDFWVAGNRLYIVLELADSNLRSRLKQCLMAQLPGLPVGELASYLREAAEALDFLHTHKITHRDVKPDNILLLNGHAKVADFGLVRQQDQLVASVSFAGTPAYIAPEVWGGEGGPASDQYGLAMAYTELRQGRLPLRFGGGFDIMLAHVEGRFDFDESLSEPEREVLRRAMSRNPEDRFPSCFAFAEELTVALGNPVRRAGTSSGIGGVGIAGSTLPTDAGRHAQTVRPTPKPIAGLETVDNPDPNPVERPPVGRRYRWVLVLGVVGFLVGVAVAVIRYGLPEPSPPVTEPTAKNSQRKGEELSLKKKGGPGAAPPIPPVVMIPPRTGADPLAERVKLADGRIVPEWVIADHSGERMRFRLIAPIGGGLDSTAPFYISQSKVWNSLYREAGKAANLSVPNHAEPGGDAAPAVDLSPNDAAAFADKVFGGRLPTPNEWDHAAGYYEQRGFAAPLRPGGTPRVGLAIPGPAHGPEALLSQNQYDLCDMAGNGREWTSAVLDKRGGPFRRVVGAAFQPTDLVVLRGRNYTLRTHLTYDILREEQTDPQTQWAGKPNVYTGFRIVLPLPDSPSAPPG